MPAGPPTQAQRILGGFVDAQADLAGVLASAWMRRLIASPSEASGVCEK
jgi:hypothetical protein